MSITKVVHSIHYNPKYLLRMAFMLIVVFGSYDDHQIPDRPQLPSTELLRSPYLQNNFADSISILWKTSDSAVNC